ncbi:IS1/IS1595 family N-terminal zinc-binding domain-containing protein [Saccharolobus islandicus]|uniref:IS1/IS1595 family N-terminal zinc-binding domain-containing protein n=1 Tax=Saccharolobus islandicus TaxID=43080 RepID=UPI003D7D7F9A
MGRKAVVRQDVSCPSCGSHNVVKCGRPLGRQRYLCRDCGKYFLGDATYHSKKLREEALRLYANGMSMRAISRVLNVPLGTVFTWIKRYGGQKYEKLVKLWGKTKGLVKGSVVTKVVDEMWAYLYKNTRTFYKWIFTCYVYTRLGVYLIYSVGDRNESTFRGVKKYLLEEGRWVSDDYNLYFWLKGYTVISPVNPNESLYSSLRERLVRFKRATKAVNGSISTMMYHIALVLWEKRLISAFVA